MRRVAIGTLLMAVALTACDSDFIIGVDTPAAPEALAASYYGGVVTVSWELGSGWNGDPFRVYSRRITDIDYFLIAEVTSCAASLCTYEDANVAAGETYEYYVAAVDMVSGPERLLGRGVRALGSGPAGAEFDPGDRPRRSQLSELGGRRSISG